MCFYKLQERFLRHGGKIRIPDNRVNYLDYKKWLNLLKIYLVNHKTEGLL